jgi:hypothetical protein
MNVMPSHSHVSSVTKDAQVIIMVFEGNSAAAEDNMSFNAELLLHMKRSR